MFRALCTCTGFASNLRLPRIHSGGSDRLPFSCFRLQDQRFTGRGRSPRAVSGGPSTGRTRGSGGTLPVTSRASPLGCEVVFVWGRSPGEVCLSPAAAARVQETVMLLPVGPLHHGTPKQDGVGKAL